MEPRIEVIAGHFCASWGDGICRQYLQRNGGRHFFAHYFPTVAQLEQALDLEKAGVETAKDEAEVG